MEVQIGVRFLSLQATECLCDPCTVHHVNCVIVKDEYPRAFGKNRLHFVRMYVQYASLLSNCNDILERIKPWDIHFAVYGWHGCL